MNLVVCGGRGGERRIWFVHKRGGNIKGGETWEATLSKIDRREGLLLYISSRSINKKRKKRPPLFLDPCSLVHQFRVLFMKYLQHVKSLLA